MSDEIKLLDVVALTADAPEQMLPQAVLTQGLLLIQFPARIQVIEVQNRVEDEEVAALLFVHARRD